MSEIINVPMAQQRDIKTVTAEIRTLTIQGQRLALEYAIEIGRRLKEAKSMLAHGQWGPWLKEEVEFSQSTANNFMRIFEEYGADQISIFGAEAESKTLGNLPYTKALKLLAMPAEEREAFVEENDVAHMSSRELEQAIKERDQARSEMERALEELDRERDASAEMKAQRDAAEQSVRVMGVAQENAAKSVADLKERLAEKAKEQERIMGEVKALREKLTLVETERKKVDTDREKEIREAAYKEASAVYEEKKAEVAKEAEAAASEKAKAKEDKLKKTVAEKTRQVEEIREEMERLRKQLATASPDTAQFKILFEAVQTDFNRMLGLLLKIRQEDADRGQKLTKAVTTVLEAWGKQVTA